MELKELFEAGKPNIISERKHPDGNTMVVRVPWIQADKKNQNKRFYKLDLLKREVSRLQGAVKKGSLIGTGDHPAGGLSDVKTASHIVQKLWLDEAGKGWADIKIIPTDRGSAVMTLIQNDAELGVSARGFGSVDEKTGEVLSDYHLVGIDVVMNPSYKEGVFSKKDIFESLEFEEDEDAQRQKDLEEEIVNIEKQSYLNALDSGFDGTQIEWEELHGGDLREMMGIKKEDGKTTVEKLTEEQIKSRTLSYFEEAREAGFKGDFSQWKKAFPHIVERASKAVKISEQKKKEPEKSFVGDVRFYYNEAVKAGYKNTIGKFKEEHPELVSEDYEEKIAEEAKPKKQETLTEEAERIFTELKKQNPHSSTTLESVKRVLEKEELVKSDKRLRKRAIQIVSRDVAGNVPQAQLERMVEKEFQVLREERASKLRKMGTAYRRLLNGDE